MRSIFGIIAKSPFTSINQHTKKVHETATQLRPLIECFTEGDWSGTMKITRQIYKLEHQADQLKDEIRDHLPRSLFLPVDRGDLLLFLREQDAIADSVEDVGDVLNMRETPTPAGLKEPVFALVDQVIRTSETWYSAANELTTLQAATFTGNEAERVLKVVDDVNHQEWEADKLEAAALKSLFTFEEEIGAVSVLLWMKIIATTGRVADHAENTADLLRLMIARA